MRKKKMSEKELLIEKFERERAFVLEHTRAPYYQSTLKAHQNPYKNRDTCDCSLKVAKPRDLRIDNDIY